MYEGVNACGFEDAKPDIFPAGIISASCNNYPEFLLPASSAQHLQLCGAELLVSGTPYDVRVLSPGIMKLPALS